ncbi:uncharacterized protein LOC141529331 [Cotesia typhae]|uniref:uncharacterized protein LOC141529331 n=1 Tax=Cotesia typhae TaxID=2053667 RepID=UPI003D689D87
MVDVDETGKIILNKIKQKVDKEHKKIKRIETSRGVNPKTNDEEIVSAKSIFDVDPEKTSTSSGKRRAIGFIMTSSDEDNEPGKIRVVPRKKNKNQTQNDYDEFSAMGDVSENEEIITNVKPSFIEETGRTQIGRNVDRPRNLDQNRFSKSYFGANFRKVSSLTGKRRAISPIISSSDDNSDSDGVRALPKEDNHEKSSERIDVNKNEKLFHKISPNLDEENESLDANRNVRQPINREEYQSSRSYFKTNFGKIFSLTAQSKFRDEIVKSSDEENNADEAIVDQDYDKALKKLNVNENKKMASSNVTSNVETGKKIQIKKKIHPLINDEETALSRSSFTANYNKLSSLTVKQKASHPIFTSSDEDKDSNETEVIPKKNVEKSTKIVDVHFESPSLKIKNITAQKDKQYDSSVNNEKILFSRPKFNTDLQTSFPSTSQNLKTNKTDDLKKLTTLFTKMNTIIRLCN